MSKSAGVFFDQLEIDFPLNEYLIEDRRRPLVTHTISSFHTISTPLLQKPLRDISEINATISNK